MKRVILIAMLLTESLLICDVWGADAASVRTLLVERCALCHRGESAPLGLKLDTLEGLMEGSNNGPVVVQGDPGSSEIIRRVQGVSQPRMPMTGPPWLTDDDVTMLSDWIVLGADIRLDSGSAPEDQTNVASSSTDGNIVTYLDVAPIFAQRCAKCHSNAGLMGPAPEGLKLTSYEDTLASNERVRVIPGNPEGSELLRRVRGLSTPRMPLDGPPFLSNDEINLIEQWIEGGATDSLGQLATIPVGAKVRFEGVFTDRNQIDDANFITNSETRIDKNPRRGRRAELRARVNQDGELVATRLREK